MNTFTTRQAVVEIVNPEEIEPSMQSGSNVLCEFLSAKDPLDPKFDQFRQAVKARLSERAEGKELLDRLEGKIQRSKSNK